MSAKAQSPVQVRGLGQTLQKGQRWRKLVRLSGDQEKIHQPAGGVADADDLGAEPAARTAQGFRLAGGAANESQTHRRRLLGRAPAAF